MSNDPYEKPAVCHRCGCTSEDFIELDENPMEADWECPECGALLDENDLVSAREWCREMREDMRLSDAGL